MSSHAENAEKALRMVREAPELTFDTETSGLDWKRNFPIGWVIGSDPANVVYVPTRHGGGGNLPGGPTPTEATGKYAPHPFEVELAQAFKYRNDNNVGKIIGHHMKFDAHAAATVGVMLGRNLTCTQNNQALINEYSRSFSLDGVAQYHKVTAKKGDELYAHLANLFGGPAERSSMQYFWRLSGDDMLGVDYATGDGVSTWEVWQAQKKELEAQDLERVLAVENDLIWTLFRIERRGIAVNEQYLKELVETIEDRVDQAYKALPDGFNPRSTKQVHDYVSRYATDWPVTEKGNPSFTEKWLKTFPEGKNIIAVRKWTNLANSFARPLLEEHTFEGRVHPTLNQNKADDYGTVSGRLSCSHPNLQQVPKHDKDLAPLIRKAFVADPGYKFYEGDYSQMEPRMFAHYSKEPELLDGYNATPPRDVHTVVADMFQADRNTVAKRMNMGMFTGMQPKSFAVHMGLDLPEATKLWNRWFAMFPGIRKFQQDAKHAMMVRGYVRSILGRRGRLEKRGLEYKATSKVIQNGGADVIKYKMVECDKMLEDAGDVSHILVSVHDSMVWQSPDTPEGHEEALLIKSTMENVMGEPFNLRVPFAVDLHGGNDWAEASFGK